jgi:hypothetical protein
MYSGNYKTSIIGIVVGGKVIAAKSNSTDFLRKFLFHLRLDYITENKKLHFASPKAPQ